MMSMTDSPTPSAHDMPRGQTGTETGKDNAVTLTWPWGALVPVGHCQIRVRDGNERGGQKSEAKPPPHVVP